MKKIALLSLACAALMGSANANAQEVTYVEDCSQGILMNKFKDNWFITLQGGGSFLNSNYDTEAKFQNRIGGAAGLFVGKWFSPVIGLRAGASWMLLKGATFETGYFRDMNKNSIDGDGKYYPEKFMTVGPEIDVLLNLTNWWCGYRPARVYNAVLHGGFGGYWTLNHRYKGDDIKWRSAHNRTLFANLGLQNNFRLSNHFNFFIDVQYTVMNNTLHDKSLGGGNDMTGALTAQVGFTYNFGKSEWNCPVTAVCPTWKYTDAEGDALVARLANADNKIKDLQRQLDDCLNRPKTVQDCEDVLATIYYPINVSTLSARERTLVASMASVMKQNPDKKYILTGWADNYTGNNSINTRLRNERVNGVAKQLKKCGVPASQIQTRIDDKNLTDFGAKGASFDRAVTIVEAK